MTGRAMFVVRAAGPRLPWWMAKVAEVEDRLKGQTLWIVQAEGLPAWVPGTEPYYYASFRDLWDACYPGIPLWEALTQDRPPWEPKVWTRHDPPYGRPGHKPWSGVPARDTLAGPSRADVPGEDSVVARGAPLPDFPHDLEPNVPLRVWPDEDGRRADASLGYHQQIPQGRRLTATERDDLLRQQSEGG